LNIEAEQKNYYYYFIEIYTIGFDNVVKAG